MTSMGNLFDMMKNAKQMIDQIKSAHAELARQTMEGAAGAGLVSATVNGLGELVALKFDKSVINPEDPEMLADLVIAAVADARKKTENLRNDAFKDLTGGGALSSLGIDFPGLT